MQECEIGLVRIRRSPGRLAFAAPDMRRTGRWRLTFWRR